MKATLLFLILYCLSTSAQITITSTDVSNMFAVGNTVTIHEDTLQSSVNIGVPGGGNNWDFTNLQSNLTLTLESVNPASTPYISDFPGANICTYNNGFSGTTQSETWTYSNLTSNYDVLGTASTTSLFPGIVTTIKNDPYRRESQHPMTFNSQWSNTYTQTIYINGAPITSSNISLSNVVDAYGTMTLPGGASYDALRLKETLTINGETSVSFSFLAKNGAQVDVGASGSNPPDNGVIPVDGTTYYGPLTTSVKQLNTQPTDYALKQNYPNPFNPSTNINFSIPQSSFVTLQVFNTLGERIDVLVSEELNAGAYNYNWNASNLTSGIYFYKLQAGNFVETKKMVLMK